MRLVPLSIYLPIRMYLSKLLTNVNWSNDALASWVCCYSNTNKRIHYRRLDLGRFKLCEIYALRLHKCFLSPDQTYFESLYWVDFVESVRASMDQI